MHQCIARKRDLIYEFYTHTHTHLYLQLPHVSAECDQFLHSSHIQRQRLSATQTNNRVSLHRVNTCCAPSANYMNFLKKQLPQNFQKFIIEYRAQIIIITSDVLEHKWQASLKTILFYMNDLTSNTEVTESKVEF